MPDFPSIVSSSVLDAIGGEFGNHHVTPHTLGSELFINALMGLYWAFELEAVAERNLYLKQLRETETIAAVSRVVEEFRATCNTIKPWESIPL